MHPSRASSSSSDPFVVTDVADTPLLSSSDRVRGTDSRYSSRNPSIGIHDIQAGTATLFSPARTGSGALEDVFGQEDVSERHLPQRPPPPPPPPQVLSVATAAGSGSMVLQEEGARPTGWELDGIDDDDDVVEEVLW